MGKQAGKKQLKRRHHTVPQLYLRRFADEAEQFIRVPVGGGERRPIGVVHATVQKDFYSFRNAAGDLDDSMEDFFGEIEAEAAKVLRLVVEQDQWPLPAGARVTLAHWIAAQLVRGPAARAVMAETLDFLTKIQIGIGGRPELRRHLERDAGGPVADEEVEEMWKEMTDFSSYSIDLPAIDHLSSIPERIRTLAPLLLGRSWVLVRFERRALLTSDHPVALAAGPNATEHTAVGVANAGAIILPLDRRAAIIMYDPAPDFRLPGTTRLARFINQHVAWSARAAVFHHPDDNPLDGIQLLPQRGPELQFSHAPDDLIHPDGLRLELD
ncbi:DUF4238 domain-containing protein [Streptomyces sp. NRRL B-24484]|uniref:DUF4238 domain-containing protein n=1 Tax=Streptomyces sp. NRRL B-24484 TaxID=1463833 RepID=UPI0004BFEC76|nr:DUF4238 domain-containing protein [Streptomyces sp. NRRL B-24484]